MSSATLAETIAARRSVRDYADAPVPLEALERILFAGQGVTDADGHRAAPSAHALYPLRVFVASGRVEGLATGLHVADPASLELSLHEGEDVRAGLKAAAVDDQTWIENAAAVVCICGDGAAAATHFADQQPYGTRGERYLYIEAGAAAQGMLLAAAGEGLGAVLVAGFRDEATSDVLGLDAPLLPLLHICIGVKA